MTIRAAEREDREQRTSRTTKVSVSLPTVDIAFVDRYAAEFEIGSRSAVLHKAIELLRASQLSDAYADAWDEWESSDEAEIWESSTADGLAH